MERHHPLVALILQALALTLPVPQAKAAPVEAQGANVVATRAAVLRLADVGWCEWSASIRGRTTRPKPV